MRCSVSEWGKRSEEVETRSVLGVGIKASDKERGEGRKTHNVTPLSGHAGSWADLAEQSRWSSTTDVACVGGCEFGTRREAM